MDASRAGKMYAVTLVAILFLRLDISLGQIQVLPNSEDRLIVLDDTPEAFVKRCEYTGSGNLDRWCWFHGTVQITDNITPQGNSSRLSFIPSSGDSGGSYRCEALDNQMNVLASADVGNLTVAMPEDVVLLIPVQYVGRGENIELTCTSTLPETSVSWRKDSSGETSSTQVYSITSAGEADKGIYTCFVIRDSNGNNIAQRSLELHVLIFPNITRIPGDMTLGNENITLEVEFESSFRNTTTVNWFKDDNRLTGNSSMETYLSNDEKGISRLTFKPARRSDSGVYTVEILNSNNNIPTNRRNVLSQPFKMTVIVPPITPGRPMLSMLNATTTHIRWTLPTPSSPDAAPDRLLLELTNHSQSQIKLPPNIMEISVAAEPGVLYTATITSFNVDGARMSAPNTLFTTPSVPGVSDVLIHRVNQTTFNVTVLVQFTGGGPSASLKLVDVEYRDMLGGVGGWLPIEPSIPLVRDATDMSKWTIVLMREGFTNLRMVEFMFRIQNNIISDTTGNQQIQGVSVPPGQPVILSGTPTTTSLNIVARLSSEGTSPLSTLHTVITAAGHPTRVLTKNDSLAVGGEVGVLITGLVPDVSYTVYVYVDNAAGLSPQSPQRIFTTASKATDFPVWLIALVAIVCSCILVALTLVILISCYCKRHGKHEQKINLSAESGSNGVRQIPLGAAGSNINKVPSFSGYSTISVADDSKFNLEPPPQGHSTGQNSVFSSLVHEPYSNSRSNYIYPTTKPRPHAGSFSGSDMSDHSAAKYFQYRQSPAHRSFITEDQLSHSMPVLEDADLTPTMPPNCSTDV